MTIIKNIFIGFLGKEENEISSSEIPEQSSKIESSSNRKC
jgi:hypothetical protein